MQYFACAVEFLLSITEKSRIYKNHGIGETRTQNP